MKKLMAAVYVATALASNVSDTAGAHSPVTSEEQPLAERYLDPVAGLTLEEAITAGLEREPGLLAARTDVESASGMVGQAELRPNPSVSVMRQEQISGADNMTIAEVEVPLELFRRKSRVAAAELAREAATHSVSDRERMLAAEIRSAYGDLAAAARDLQVSDDLVDATRRSYELLVARVEEGAAPPLEKNMVEVELRRIESHRLLQAGRAEAALIELKRLLAVELQETVRVRSTLDALVQGEAVELSRGDVATAVSNRPDVLEAEASLRLAEARIEEAGSQGRFDMSLFGSYTRMDFSFPQTAFGPSGDLEPIQDIFHNVAAGAKVTVPVRNANEGAIAAARAERAGAEYRRRARVLAAVADVAAAMAQDEHAQRAVAIYASGARELARQNLEVVRQAYELGRSSLSDVLDEQRRYLEVEMGYTEALQTAFDARTALRRSLGEMQ